MNLFGDIVNIGEDANNIYVKYIMDATYVVGVFDKSDTTFQNSLWRHAKAVLEKVGLYVTPGSTQYKDYKSLPNRVVSGIVKDNICLLKERLFQISLDKVITSNGTLTSLSCPNNKIYDWVSANQQFKGGVCTLCYDKNIKVDIWDSAYAIADLNTGEVVIIPHTNRVVCEKDRKFTQQGNEYEVTPAGASPYYCNAVKLNKGFAVYV